MRGVPTPGVVLAFVLLAVPLSGCLGAGPATIAFGDWRLPAGSPAPVPADDCAALLQTLNERALQESDALLEQSLAGHGWGGGRGIAVFAVEDAAETASNGAASSAGAEYTGTNNQESGVDEADILKTDGEWTYVLQDGHLYIMRNPMIGTVLEYARIEIGPHHGGQLLLERRHAADVLDDRLILITHDGGAYGWAWHDHRTETRIRVIELGDRTDPQVVKEIRVEGYIAGARLVDGNAYIVVHTHQSGLRLETHTYPSEEELAARGLDWRSYDSLSEGRQERIRTEIAKEHRAANRALIAKATLADHLPLITDRGATGVSTVRAWTDEACSQVLLTPDATGRSVSTIVAIDAAADEAPDSILQTLGSQPIVYGALDVLVLAAPSRDAWWFHSNARVDEATDLQWFTLDGLHVTHRASGRIPGTVLDSFAIDVAADTLRVATTTGQWNRWWLDGTEREPMMNHLIILEEKAQILVPAGIVGGIAPGERIWSARFTDTRAYIVTFEQIDPLWIIDLTDKTQPRILGELEIPGVSTYIHPLSDELLLAIGYGPGADGLGLDWRRIQVSLFDISDEHAPKRAALMDISPPGGWSWSGATHEHKAFTYWGRLGLLAVPMTTSGYTDGIHQQQVSLRIIHVDAAQKTLTLHGDVTHENLVEEAGDHVYGAEIQRSYFIGHPDRGIVSVHSMSRLGMSVHALQTLEEQDHVHFHADGWPYQPHMT